ncbi:MAG: UDP-N-acetylmuramoyl-L-alanine--D-glutamate ligase, partial [Rhodospirillales bacterium]|nr:UDP-N-acetylmuramoyl-L-alanine--D-glutamate ligase [Rhodospirillales bacterium]
KAIFANQGPTHTAVIGVDTEPSHEIYAALQKSRNQTVVPISGNTPVSGGVFVENGILIDDSYYRREPIMDLRDVVTLTGEHNWQNAAASFATFRAIGLEVDEIVSGMGTYPGLSHRQEIVKTIDGVLFVNDSKATNPDAAARALASYTNIYWIAGGQSKEGGFDQLLPYLKNVHHAYLVGDDAELIHQAIYSDASCTISGNIADATAAAYRQAVKDGNESAVVMFSPACASFDQFKNFEERGDHFKQCVASIHTKSRGVA